MTNDSKIDILGLTAHIVSAYVENNKVPATGLPDLIASVNNSILALDKPAAEPVEAQQPAVNPKRSVFPDYIICLEDGKKFKSLKRHLSVDFGLSPEEYRAKWGLPADYPMVAPNYAAARSQLARTLGLGRKAGETQAKPRGRAKKA
ncbi:MAG: MucR family transcriptional regulator [Proteobacteria bacterium]|uniref:MucR family transcriptional regulator n=1 Tax=Hyphomicrobiales TaxID=356 RepID=UPI00037C5C44|nr:MULTISPECIES: MucR family transcriptional regulator [Phyllobacteriaceae]MCA0274855.1 MucR family transcriptional regulator [Pseudomonadota bacterium]MCX8568321.1 MucR family transcriptional regulator [Aminobacter sp. MET-1]